MRDETQKAEGIREIAQKRCLMQGGMKEALQGHGHICRSMRPQRRPPPMGPPWGDPGDRGLGEGLGPKGATDRSGLPTVGPSFLLGLRRPRTGACPRAPPAGGEVPYKWGANVLGLCS